MLGVNIFHSNEQDEAKRFSFRHGPIFSQVVLADELNRASPKTQSALLEAMEERQVSIDGVTHALPSPFFVIATQNPSYQSGTYPLPESQLDRFFMRISLGYPAWEAEKAMLLQQDASAPLAQILNEENLREMQREVAAIHTSDAIIHYILRLWVKVEKVMITLTPYRHERVERYSKVPKPAFVSGKSYVTPEDVQAVFVAITAHGNIVFTIAQGQQTHAFDGENWAKYSIVLTHWQPSIWIFEH